MPVTRSLTEGAQPIHFRDLQPSCLLLIIYYAGFIIFQLRINSKIARTQQNGEDNTCNYSKKCFSFPIPKEPEAIPPETSTGVQPIPLPLPPPPSHKPCRRIHVTTICFVQISLQSNHTRNKNNHCFYLGCSLTRSLQMTKTLLLRRTKITSASLL